MEKAQEPVQNKGGEEIKDICYPEPQDQELPQSPVKSGFDQSILITSQDLSETLNSTDDSSVGNLTSSPDFSEKNRCLSNESSAETLSSTQDFPENVNSSTESSVGDDWELVPCIDENQPESGTVQSKSENQSETEDKTAIQVQTEAQESRETQTETGQTNDKQTETQNQQKNESQTQTESGQSCEKETETESGQKNESQTQTESGQSSESHTQAETKESCESQTQIPDVLALEQPATPENFVVHPEEKSRTVKCSSCDCELPVLKKCSKHADAEYCLKCGPCGLESAEQNHSTEMNQLRKRIGFAIPRPKTPFYCYACDDYFPHKSALQKHAAGVHEVAVRMAFCKRCGMVFIDEKGVRDHWLAKHGRKRFV